MFARIEEDVEQALRERVEHLGEPPSLRVGDPFTKDLQGRRGAFEGHRPSQVVVEQATSRPCPASVASVDRFAEVRQASGVTEVGAGHPSDSRGRVRDGGGRAPRRASSALSATTIASSDLPCTASTPATSVSAPTSSGEGPSGSRSSSASSRERPLPWVAEPAEHEAERAHRAGGGGDLTGRTEGRDRLLQRLGCLGVASGLAGGLAEAGERLGSFGMSSEASASARSRFESAAAVSSPSARSPARDRNFRAGASSSPACSVCPAAFASSSAVA